MAQAKHSSPQFDAFVSGMTTLVERYAGDETQIMQHGRELLASLISDDAWLPEMYRQGSEDGYRQYLLYLDPEARFSVVSFVWGPGQKTPIHDHTVWGMVGMLSGRELCEEFALDEHSGAFNKTAEHLIEPGSIDLVSPAIGDIHRVSNALADSSSISIHVYGGDIGTISRHSYSVDGSKTDFVSGYSDL